MASTNKTPNIELSQYIGTDKPTYLTDYNTDMLKIDTAVHTASAKATTNETNIGTMTNLTTTEKSSLVGAINEVNTSASKVGNLSSLTTSDKTSVVGAINEVDGDVGTLSSLTTTAKSDVVGAINELDGEIGNLSELRNPNQQNLVQAINRNTLGVEDTNRAITKVEQQITSYLTLNDNRDLSNPTIASGGGSISGNSIRVALNKTGTLGKIYGTMNVSNTTGQSKIRFANSGIKSPQQEYTINNCGFVRRTSDNVVAPCNIKIIPADISQGQSSATVELVSGISSSANDLIFSFIPCIIFFEDFGDTE